MKKDMVEIIELPQETSAIIDENLLTIKGTKGELSREFYNPQIVIEAKDNKIQIISKLATKREKALIFTFKAHVNNMILGVNKGHKYKLKICSGHFPMNVSYNNNIFTIKNFLGEAVPRILTIKPGINVNVDGQIITVEGLDKEKTGQAAANIEQLTRITNRDRRIFQDGIYIIKKAQSK